MSLSQGKLQSTKTPRNAASVSMRCMTYSGCFSGKQIRSASCRRHSGIRA